MRPMKPVYAVALLAALALPVRRRRAPHAGARCSPTDAGRPPGDDGQAHGVLTGEMADAITRRFGATSPILIDVTTEKHYAQPGCSRLKVTFWQDGVRPSDDSAATDDGLRHQLLPRRPAATIPEVEPI